MTFAKEDKSPMGKCPHCKATLDSIKGQLIDAYPDVTRGRKVTKVIYKCPGCETILGVGDF